MKNRFNLNEEEKNRIKGLHSIGVIEEQWKTIELGEEEEWERGKKKRGKSGPGTYGNDDVFPGPEESAISRFLKSKPEGGGEMLEGERKANEILKYIEFEVRGWIFDNNKRVTQETPGYFLENNSKMVAKIAEILS